MVQAVQEHHKQSAHLVVQETQVQEQQILLIMAVTLLNIHKLLTIIYP